MIPPDLMALYGHWLTIPRGVVFNTRLMEVVHKVESIVIGKDGE